MANTTILDTVTVATTGSGVQITGDFNALATGSMAGGILELQVATADTDALYKPVGTQGQWTGPGAPTAIRNPGTLWYRGVLKGCLASMLPASAKLEASQ